MTAGGVITGVVSAFRRTRGPAKAGHYYEPAPDSRRGLAAWLAIPTLVVALGLCAIEAWRAIRPRSALFQPPFVYSLADAIAVGELPQAYAFIRAGQDPNEPIWVRHPVFTGRRWVRVSPLLWAVATRNGQAVDMLIAFGARLERRENSDAVCLAQRVGDQGIERALRLNGAPTAAGDCPASTKDDPVLVHLLDISN